MTDARNRLMLLVGLFIVLGVGVLRWRQTSRVRNAAALTGASSATATTALPQPAPLRLHVPRAIAPIRVDGDLDEVTWQKSASRTGAFVAANGEVGRPYSDARFAWDDENLYVGLYAADEDIRATKSGVDAPLWLDDAFRLAFVRADVAYLIDIAPNGQITDARALGQATPDFAWSSMARVACEMDGTLNEPTDDDEEWVVEMAIPLVSFDGVKAGDVLGFSARRCDVPHGAARVCAAFGSDAQSAELVLDR